MKRGIKDGSIHPMDAKERLALEIVERYHGRERALRAKEYFDRVIRKKDIPEDIPLYEARCEEALWIPRLLKDSGILKSTSEARRLIEQKAIEINGEVITDPDAKLTEGEYLFRIGKRKFLRVRLLRAQEENSGL